MTENKYRIKVSIAQLPGVYMLRVDEMPERLRRPENDGISVSKVYWKAEAENFEGVVRSLYRPGLSYDGRDICIQVWGEEREFDRCWCALQCRIPDQKQIHEVVVRALQFWASAESCALDVVHRAVKIDDDDILDKELVSCADMRLGPTPRIRMLKHKIGVVIDEVFKGGLK